MTSEEAKIDAVDRLFKEAQSHGLDAYLQWSSHGGFYCEIVRKASWYKTDQTLVAAVDHAINDFNGTPCERPCSWSADAVSDMFEEIHTKGGDIRLLARFAADKGYIFHASIDYQYRAYAHCAEEAMFKAYDKWCKAKAGKIAV